MSAVFRDALLSKLVYREGGHWPSDVYQVGTQALGFPSDFFVDDKIGLKSALFYDAARGEFIYAFAGTDGASGADWGATVAHATIGVSPQLRRALSSVRLLAKQLNGNLTLTGLSWGGALAAAAASAYGLQARVFNPGAVSSSDPWANHRGPDRVSTDILLGDPVNFLQDLHPIVPDSFGTRTYLSPRLNMGLLHWAVPEMLLNWHWIDSVMDSPDFDSYRDDH